MIGSGGDAAGGREPGGTVFRRFGGNQNDPIDLDGGGRADVRWTNGPGGDCKEQLADVDKLMNSAIDAKKRQDATKYVEQAKAALAKEDENGCIVHAQNARRTLLGD